MYVLMFREFKIVVENKKYCCFFFNQIVKKIIERKQVEMQKVYLGLKCFKEGVRQISIENILGVLDRGWKFDLDKRLVDDEIFVRRLRLLFYFVEL